MEYFNEPTHSKDDVLHLWWRQKKYVYRTAIQVYYENANRKKKKALCWVVIEIMSVLIREGPVALLW